MDKKDILNEVKKLLFGEEEPMDELKFVEAVLQDGTKIKVEGEELLEGLPVFVVTEEGDVPAPDGQHTLEDGTVVETLEGLIVSVTKAESMEEVAEEVAEEEFEDETKTKVDVKPAVGELFNMMEEIQNRLQSVENFNKNIKEEYSKDIKNLKDATVLLTEEFSNLPGGDKVELKKSGYQSTINERLNTKQERLERIRKTLKG